jgi:hypothetical protein
MGIDQEIKEMLKKPDRADYVVELYFDDSFSAGKRNMGVVSLWKRCSLGLEKVYQCPKCDALINNIYLGAAKTEVPCEACGAVTVAMDLKGEVLYGMDVDKWAHRVAQYVRHLNMDTDVVLKRSKLKKSFIEAAQAAREGGRGLDMLAEAREKEGAHYTKKALLKDMQGGTSLEGAIKAFLLA